jgi:colanic acid/amylovoran biosynthesis glycosyltransferase
MSSLNEIQHCKGTAQLRVGYVLKMYPRFSETFIVNEMLAHEAVGLPLQIYSLRPPADGRFHENYAKVQAEVTYVQTESSRASSFWELLRPALREFPALAQIVSTEDVELGDLSQAIWLARAVREDGITLMHAHFGTLATTVARIVYHLTGIPYVFTAHAKDIFHESVNKNDLAQKLVDAAAIITVSDFNAAHLRATFQSELPHLYRIYNGLDLDHFTYESSAQRPPKILGVGRLIEKKGFDVLIEACAILVQQGYDFTCDIIGTGALEGQLHTRIAALDLKGHVHLRGPQSQERVIQSLRDAAVFAAPCVVGADGNRDGLPTVLLEAMALGTPCVSTDVTGIPEILQDHKTGLQVAQNDAHDLARSLARLLEDTALRTELAQNARKMVETNFDIHRNAAQIRALYRKLTPQHPHMASDASEHSQPMHVSAEGVA